VYVSFKVIENDIENDRPYKTFYWSAIVNTAVCSTIVKLFDVE